MWSDGCGRAFLRPEGRAPFALTAWLRPRSNSAAARGAHAARVPVWAARPNQRSPVCVSFCGKKLAERGFRRAAESGTPAACATRVAKRRPIVEAGSGIARNPRATLCRRLLPRVTSGPPSVLEFRDQFLFRLRVQGRQMPARSRHDGFHRSPKRDSSENDIREPLVSRHLPHRQALVGRVSNGNGFHAVQIVFAANDGQSWSQRPQLRPPVSAAVPEEPRR